MLTLIFSLKEPFKKSPRGPQKWSQNRIKTSEKRKTAQTRRRHGRAQAHGRPCTGARPTVYRRTVVRTASRALALPVSAASAWGARPCTPEARPCAPCFPLFCYSWCSGLPQTFNLPWNRSWSLLFYRNMMTSPEMKNERILGTIKSKGR